jgi:hypothetical protein
MVEEDDTPANQHCTSGERYEPKEDGQGTARQGHEGKKGESEIKRYADIGNAPPIGAEEDARSLSLDRQPVEDTCPSQQSLIAGAEGGSDEDCVDDGRNTFDARCRCDEHEWRGRCCSRIVTETRIVTGHKHADNEDHRKV